MTNAYQKRLKILEVFSFLLLLCFIMPFTGRLWIHYQVTGHIYHDWKAVPKCKTALVLGCRVIPNGSLSTLLADRVRTAVNLYKKGKVQKLLMSGDNRKKNYNEPQAMRDYAVKLGVPPQDVVMDFAGRRTYDSIYRTIHIFGQKRFIIVSQQYHLDRALYLSHKMGADAYGVPGVWPGHFKDHVREFGACIGAIVDTTLRNPKPVMGRKETL